MELIEGLKLRGRPAEIPDCSRDDLPQFFVDMGFKVGAEIGVDKAKFTERLCKVGLKIYGVDPWLCYDGYDPEFGQKKLDDRFERCKRTLAPYDCTLIRKTSMEAVKDFEDGSLDFVYIDGHHGLKWVVEDIFEWSKKVKKGGIVSGHDFARNAHPIDGPWVLQVVPAVRAYVDAFQIKNWYLLGSPKPGPEERRDTFRSWMWINP